MEQRRLGLKVPVRLAVEMQTKVKIESARKVNPKPTIYAEVSPADTCDFVGTVRAVERNINVPELFGLPATPIARRLLGRLGNGRWHRLRLREEPTAEPQPIVAEMSPLVRPGVVTRLGIRESQKVFVSVVPYSPPGQEPVSIVAEVTVLAG